MSRHQDGRLKVHFSDSTLNHYWDLCGYGGDELHVEHNTIPGARPTALIRAYEATYGQIAIPQDVVISGGSLNAINQGQSAEQVIAQLQQFSETVMANNIANTVAFTTIPQPPRLCWMKGNNRVLKWDKFQVPFPGYVNKIEEVTKVNHAIQDMNNVNGVKPPHLHMFGIRGDRHRFSDWRQTEEMGDQMHLVNKKMVTMGESIVKYFQKET